MVNEAIVARAAQGDTEAFRNIVEDFEPRIYRFLYGLVRDPELARDLTQDTFVSAFSALGRTSPDLKLAAWLYTIARNHALSEFRRRRVVSWVPLFRHRNDYDAEEEPQFEESTSVADEVIARQTLHSVLGKLNAESRTLLLLSADGFTYAEIGRMTSLSEAAVRQRIFRSRERLRVLCKDWEV